MIQTQNKPYYDDFEVTKGFLKVLFKPELSVQTRELNQLQSILQNQIGTLADSIYKDGSVVKDGRLIFKNDVDYAKFFTTYNSVTFNYDNFKGRKVYGSSTQIVASVFDGFDYDSTNPATLYLNYLCSGVNQEKTFSEDEIVYLVNEIYVSEITGTFIINETLVGDTNGCQAKLIVKDNNKFELVYLNSNRFEDGEIIRGSTSSAYCTFSSGESTQYQIKVQDSSNVTDPIGYGSFVIVSNGVYYVDGYFVNVEPQQVIVSEYSTLVSAKVGFNKEVEYIGATSDSSLYDNANGTPNENAPGADRLKLNLNLGYYNIYDDDNEQFIEIMRIENSVEVFNTSKDSQWSNILDLLAKRTYDESGNYTVNPFIVDIQEFLDENDNNGIYKETYFGFDTQTEAQNASISVFGATTGSSHLYNYKYYPLADHTTFLQACRDRVCLGVNPGLAYVLGYEAKLENRIYVPMLKARELGTDVNNLLNLRYGNYCLVNTLTSLPTIHSYQTASLKNSSSTEIGTALIRMIKRDTDNSAYYRLYLIDINLTTGSFSDVKTISTSAGFSCSLIDSKLYDLDKNILIAGLSQTAVSSVTSASYYYEYQDTGTVSGNAITISAPGNAIFYSSNVNDYILSVDNSIITLTSSMLNVTSNLITITLTDSSHDQDSFSIICPVYRNSDNIRTKSLTTSNVNIASPSSSMTLSNIYDGYSLLGVYDSGDPNTAATTSSTDVTSYYTMDGGQTDNYYGFVKIKRNNNTGSASGQLLVVLKHFTHGSGDYFVANSYNTQQLDYADIPTYTAEDGTVYNLKNCIDYRPTMSASGLGAATNPYIIVPNSNFISSVSYYLPRIDILEVDYLGNFKIKKGTSSTNPQLPAGDDNAMVLYSFQIPSYTEDINSIVKVFNENKRYTMRDIGILDTRIGAVENYILLTQNEYDVSNMPITGSDGTTRYKTGYIADNFNDHSYGDLTNIGYRCAIDVTSNILRPSYKLNTIELEKDTSGTNTVVEMNNKYMIPYTNTDAIKQTVATGLLRMNSNGLVSWEGNLLITPNYNNNYNNINQVKQNFGSDAEYLAEFNTYISNSPNSLEYGNFFLNWLGVN